MTLVNDPARALGSPSWDITTPGSRPPARPRQAPAPPPAAPKAQSQFVRLREFFKPSAADQPHPASAYGPSQSTNFIELPMELQLAVGSHGTPFERLSALHSIANINHLLKSRMESAWEYRLLKTAMDKAHRRWREAYPKDSEAGKLLTPNDARELGPMSGCLHPTRLGILARSLLEADESKRALILEGVGRGLLPLKAYHQRFVDAVIGTELPWYDVVSDRGGIRNPVDRGLALIHLLQGAEHLGPELMKRIARAVRELPTDAEFQPNEPIKTLAVNTLAPKLKYVPEPERSAAFRDGLDTVGTLYCLAQAYPDVSDTSLRQNLMGRIRAIPDDERGLKDAGKIRRFRFPGQAVLASAMGQDKALRTPLVEDAKNSAMFDPDPGIRSWAIRCLGPVIGDLSDAEQKALVEDAIGMTGENQVRAIAGLGPGLGQLQDPTLRTRLVKAAVQIKTPEARARAITGLIEGLAHLDEQDQAVLVEAVIKTVHDNASSVDGLRMIIAMAARSAELKSEGLQRRFVHGCIGLQAHAAGPAPRPVVFENDAPLDHLRRTAVIRYLGTQLPKLPKDLHHDIVNAAEQLDAKDKATADSGLILGLGDLVNA